MDLSKFEERARKIIETAEALGGKEGEGVVKSEHLLLALLADTDGVSYKALVQAGIQVSQLEGVLRDVTSGKPLPPNVRRMMINLVPHPGCGGDIVQHLDPKSFKLMVTCSKCKKSAEADLVQGEVDAALLLK